MSQPIWQKLIALVELDNQLSETEKSISTLEEQLTKLETQIPILKDNLDKKIEDVSEKKKTIHAIELKLEIIDASEASKKKTLDNIKTQKEHTAIQNEISILSMERQDLEDMLVESWQNLEKESEKLEQDKANFKIESKKINTEIAEINKKITSIKMTFKEQEKMRDNETKIVPEKWLSKYNKMKSRVSNPVVRVLSSGCSACYFQILPQDLTLIKKGNLLHCRSCFRLLYWTTDQEVAAIEGEGLS